MKRKWIFLLAAILLLLAWMGIIFYMSHQSGAESSYLSTETTKGIIGKFVDNFDMLSLQTKLKLEFVIRKIAHLGEYAVLGTLFFGVLRLYGIKNYRKTAAIALLLSFLWAAGDEWHQSFIPGRSARISDVFIDTIGAAVGIFIIWAAIYFARRLQKK